MAKTAKKTPEKISGWLGCALIAVIFLAFIIGITPDSDSNSSPNIDIQDASQARFDTILNSVPKLDSIECLDDDCTSVVYFNFNSEPEEGYDYITRANTATFSSWKYNETGTSHVTIFAVENGQTIMHCSGSKGAVDSCSY